MDTNQTDAVLTGLFIIVLWVAVLAVIITALVSVIKSTNYPREFKALWAVGILAVPLVGAILWFVFGRNPEINHRIGQSNDILTRIHGHNTPYPNTPYPSQHYPD